MSQKTKPAQKKPAAKKPAPKQPAAKKPAKPASKQPAKQAAAKQPAAKKPLAKKPAPASKKNSVPSVRSPKPAAKKTAPKPAVKKLPAKKPAPTPKKSSAPSVRNQKPAVKKTAPKPAVKNSPAQKTPPKQPAVKKPAKPVSKQPAKQPAAPAAPVGNVPRDNDKKSAASPIQVVKDKPRPVAFTMEEILEIARAAAKAEAAAKQAAAKSASAKAEKIIAEKLARSAAKPTHVKPATIADILGFNPVKKEQRLDPDAKDIPERFRRFYKLLVQLRTSLTHQIDEHSEETLKKSNKDDAGDLSSYGQHDADAGTDAFDRDFALSMVASEQEALTEIDAAVQRIKAGTYGICEITHAPISKERLLAVPFTRYCADAQREIERYRLRSRTQAGLVESGDSDSTVATAGGDDAGD